MPSSSIAKIARAIADGWGPALSKSSAPPISRLAFAIAKSSGSSPLLARTRAERGYGQLQTADRPVLEEGRTTCCYAKSEKCWISDPDGVVWEAFYTDGEATTYGSPALESLAAAAAAAKCCGPTTAVA